MEKGDQLVVRHIMEIRLDNRIFSFIDYKGFLVDFLIKETDGQQIKLAEQRVDVANKNLSQSVFYSWENFGFQVEAKTDFESFHKFTDQFFAWMLKFGKYKPDTVVRIGTRSMVFYHKKGKSFQGIKDIYKNRMMKDHVELEKKIGSKINDVAYTAELKKNGDGADVRMVLGPMTFAEVMAKHFGLGRDIYSSLGFNADHSGIFMDIDLSQNGKFDYSLQQLAEAVHKNIEVMEKHMEGFISYFFTKDGE